MADNSALIELAPNDPEDRAAASVCAAQARAARQLAMLQELAEIGLQMARAVRDEALACVDAAEDDAPRPPSRFGNGDLGLVYSRIARAVRQTLALETRVADDSERSRVEREQRRVAALRWASEERQREIRDYVAEAIEAEAVEKQSSEREVERLLNDLDERIEAGDYDDRLDDAPVGELVERICADLGVIPDWNLWDDHDWAIEHLRARDPGDIGADRWRYREPPSGAADPPDPDEPPDG
jgi:hypothetical protein